jgi:hypothetical protein
MRRRGFIADLLVADRSGEIIWELRPSFSVGFSEAVYSERDNYETQKNGKKTGVAAI